MIEALGRFVYFAYRSTLLLPGAVLSPGRTLVQFYGILLGALPLALTAGLAIGAVVSMHLRAVLVEAAGPGAAAQLPKGLALAVVLEFAPIAAGLIVAGRSGASMGAELGAMRETEQIDALEMLGVSPMRALVAPRLLACMLALPLLDVFIIYLALGAGYGGEALSGGLSFTQYSNAVREVLTPRQVVPAVLKTVAFGYLIGLAGCHAGMHARGGTEGVGRAATAGVVLSIFLVLVADVVLVRATQLWLG